MDASHSWRTTWSRGEKETVERVHPFESCQAVSVTLETAYDDWCCAQMAKALNKPWFNHADLIPGGSLIFEMGHRPNTTCGSAPDAAPPSTSR